MPVVPNAAERLLFLRLNRAPALLFDVFGAEGYRAASVALKLSLFEALREGPLGPSELACRLGINEQGGLILAAKEGP
jgi:hypothetical protein